MKDLINKLKEEKHIIPITPQISKYLEQCYEYAANHSPDLSTKNAALILHELTNEVISIGANTFPEGIEVTQKRLSTRPDKYFFTEHAERMVISNAYNAGIIDFTDTTMFCPWYACHDCGRAMLNTQTLRKVIGHLSPLIWDQEAAQLRGQPDWSASIEAAFEMFDEKGIEYYFAEGNLENSVPNLHQGKIYNP
jgi:dCMP deaminase